MSVNNFISQFCQRGDQGYLSKRDASRLKDVLRNIIYKDLPNKDSMRMGMLRDFANSNNLSLTIHSENIFCKPNGDKSHLLVGVIAPCWSKGLRDIGITEAIYEEVSMFFHFAEQYVTRSRQINLIGAIALTYNRACDFRGHSLSKTELSDQNEIEAFKTQFPEVSNKLSKNEKYLIKIFKNMNALDPFINRIIFYFNRALLMNEHGFSEGSMVALDCAIDIAENFLHKRMGIKKKDQRAALSELIGLTKSQKDRLSFLYKVRCYFGAHPAYSKWWDFGELYAEEFDNIFEVVKKVIIRICELEAQNRVIDDDPNKWSEWFCDNSMLL